MAKPNWDERYQTGDLPWDTGRPDKALREAVALHSVEPCQALEIGCGTGTNAIWLARNGFEVTAVDFSPVAVELAREKLRLEDVQVNFLAADLLKDPIPGGPFGFVFDRGCFHSFDSAGERRLCAETMWKLLADEGRWYSLLGSTDGPEREVGPPRWSVLDIAAAAEPWFKILALQAIFFDSGADDAPQAWACLMQRRSNPVPNGVKISAK